MHAYTATLRLGFLVLHIIRIGSPQFIAGLNPGPAMGKYLAPVWPTSDERVWPSRRLAEIGGLIALAPQL